MTSPLPSRNSSFWRHINAVLAINLDSRADRMEQLSREIANRIPPEKFHRISAVSGKEIPGFGKSPWFRKNGGKRDANWAGRAGCVLSHRKAIARAREAGWKTLLVLEDDAVFTPHFDTVSEHLPPLLLNAATDATTTADAAAALQPEAAQTELFKIDWDVCYPGFTEPRGPVRHLASLGATHDLHQIYGCLCTHAYLLRSTTYDWLLARLPDEKNIWPWIAWHRAIDRWYSRNLARRFNVLAISPGVIKQRSDYSDITGHLSHTDGSANFSVPLPPLRRSGTAWQYHSRLHSLCLFPVSAYDRIRATGKRISGF